MNGESAGADSRASSLREHRGEQRLREELRATPIDERARGRALRVVRAAHAEREPARRRWRPVLAVVAAVLAAVIVAGSVSAPGDAVARWVKEVLGVGHEEARPALVRVPGGGRLLVTTSAASGSSAAAGASAAAGSSAGVVSGDGSRRRLGDYAGASWSPSRPGTISAARWAPVDGFRIAYLTGGSLRVVAGDGTGDRRVAAARPVAPAWRPDDDHVLAHVDGQWRVRVLAVDTGRELWRTRPLRDGVAQLAWSPDGMRLLVATPVSWLLLGRDGGGGAGGRGAPPAGFVADDCAWAPDGRRLALVRRNEQRSEVVLVRPGGGSRVLFTGSGRFGRMAFSPDGRRLLVPWPAADQWLFLSTAPGGRIGAVANIARQFAPGPRRGPFPDAVDWCCG